MVETDITYANFSADLGQLKLGNGTVVDLGTMTSEGGVVGNFTVEIINKNGKAEISIKTNVGTDTFRYQPADSIAAATNILSKRISVAKDILTIQELDGGANNVDINFQTNIKSTTTLSDLPEEELLLILEDTSNTKFSVDYSTEPVPGLSSTNFKLSLKSAEFGVYELSDADTGQSIATRTIDKDGSIIVNDLKFKVSGTPAEGDSFVVSKSFASSLKSDNIDDMLKIAKFDAANKSGEFNTKLDALLFGLSKHVSSAEIYKEAAEGSKIAVEEMIDKFSSVSLDTEAANLMQQQQAYQALARVLSTAKEMIDTLMEVI
jgi:flagellar hook-associated protein 1 FlgK